VEQLSGLDYSFLAMEDAAAHSHIGGLGIFDSETPDGPLTFEAVKDLMESRLHLVAPYRRRLVSVPLGVDRPHWVEDEAFDLDFHMRHIAVPPPGDDRQLADLVARVHSRPLDRSRPLWELYVIGGLADGRIAIYTKTHHSTIDGVSGASLLEATMDLGPEGREVEAPSLPWKPEPVPAPWEMLGTSLGSLVTQPARLVRFQLQATRSGIQAVRRRAPGIPGVGAVLDLLERVPGLSTGRGVSRHETEMLSQPGGLAPRTFFNRRITTHRALAFGSVSLDDVKLVKRTFGTTVNDVIMAACAGGLRQWLLDRDALPDQPLRAMVPISVRGEDDTAVGNQVSAMVAVLPTTEPDRTQRLALAHEAMDVAKRDHAALPADMLQEFAQAAPPAVSNLAFRLVSRTPITDVVNPPFNVVISNVPGPPFPLYTAGARMQHSFPVSAITHGVGLNITVFSYDGRVDFGLVGCSDLTGDLWPLMDHLLAEVDLLIHAAKASEASVGS